MSEYILRKVDNKYEAAKFADSTYPIDIYRVSGKSCSCPSFRLCKHIKILNTWRALGEPAGVVFDDAAKIIGKLSVG